MGISLLIVLLWGWLVHHGLVLLDLGHQLWEKNTWGKQRLQRCFTWQNITANSSIWVLTHEQCSLICKTVEYILIKFKCLNCQTIIITFGWVEDTISLDVTNVTPLGLPVVLESACLTEVMLAPKTQRSFITASELASHLHQQRLWGISVYVLLCDDRILKGLPADEALKGHVLLVTAHLIVLLIYTQQHSDEQENHWAQSNMTEPGPGLLYTSEGVNSPLAP